jgi:hypothetical protein
MNSILDQATVLLLCYGMAFFGVLAFVSGRMIFSDAIAAWKSRNVVSDFNGAAARVAFANANRFGYRKAF